MAKYWIDEDEYQAVKGKIEEMRAAKRASKEKDLDRIQELFDGFIDAVRDYYSKYHEAPEITSK